MATVMKADDDDDNVSIYNTTSHNSVCRQIVNVSLFEPFFKQKVADNNILAFLGVGARNADIWQAATVVAAAHNDNRLH